MIRQARQIDPYVITDPSQARAQERMLPEVWDERFPEQSRRYLDPRTLGEIEPAPPEARAAFEEIFHEEIREGIVLFGLDPWLKRLTVWQKRESLYGDGEVWERAIVFSDEFDPDDLLPADLAWENSDGRYDRFEGCVGAYWVPSAEDMFYLKDKVDHFRNSGKTLVCTRGWIIKKFVGKKMSDWRTAMNRLHEWHNDHLRYHFGEFYKTCVQMIGGGQHYNFLPQTSLEQLAKDMEADGSSRNVRESVKNEAGEHLYFRSSKRATEHQEPEHRLPERLQARLNRDKLEELATVAEDRLQKRKEAHRQVTAENEIRSKRASEKRAAVASSRQQERAKEKPRTQRQRDAVRERTKK